MAMGAGVLSADIGVSIMAGVLGNGTADGDFTLLSGLKEVAPEVEGIVACRACDEAPNEDAVADGGGPVEIDPVSRSTTFRGAVLPWKYSDAVSAGSSDGAGGNMSDWKVSALRGTMKDIGSTEVP